VTVTRRRAPVRFAVEVDRERARQLLAASRAWSRATTLREPRRSTRRADSDRGTGRGAPPARVDDDARRDPLPLLAGRGPRNERSVRYG
jgi:hypothetical protein